MTPYETMDISLHMLTHYDYIVYADDRYTSFRLYPAIADDGSLVWEVCASGPGRCHPPKHFVTQGEAIDYLRREISQNPKRYM